MRILTNILNFIFVVLVVIGIVSVIGLFTKYSPFKPRLDNSGAIDSLNNEIALKDVKIADIDNQYNLTVNELSKYYSLWQKEKEHVKSLKAEKSHQNQVKNLGIDEMLAYVLDYYNTDTTEARMINEGDSVYVIVTPKLINQVGNTIAEHRDNLELLEALECQVSLCDSTVNYMMSQNGLLLEKIDLMDESITNLEQRQKEYQEMYDKQIKKLKFQRNIVAVGGIILVIIVAL